MRDDPIDLQSPSYTPCKLISEACALLGATSEYRLAQVLEVDQAVLTRIRKRRRVISAYLMVQIMDRTGWHITEVRRLAGMPYEGVPKLVLLPQRVSFCISARPNQGEQQCKPNL